MGCAIKVHVCMAVVNKNLLRLTFFSASHSTAFFAGLMQIRLVRDIPISSWEKLSSANALAHLQQYQPELL
jgi:hypothetical protein